MATLIFDNTLFGHHLEYINHLYNGAYRYKDEEFIFAVPKNEWEKNQGKCEWSKANNIRWVMLDDDECLKASQGSLIGRCLRLSRLIKRVALKENVDRIKLISLADVIPFLPLLLPASVKLSGIIYKIYLRAPKSGIRGLIDRFRYKIMAKNGSMGKVFILNDPRSAERLNQIYNSDHFLTLADPIPTIENKVMDLRPELGISQNSKIYLHFGAMDERKGTLEILQAIGLMTPQELSGRTFIFAGRVNRKIKDRFYELVDKIRQLGADIIIRDEFCTYDFLHSLCYTSDYILMPYLLTDLSSGVLGYAAIYGKSVIGPNSGLIGELIRDNELGVAIDISPESLKEAILCPQISSSESGRRKYIERNTKNRFVEDFLG